MRILPKVFKYLVPKLIMAKLQKQVSRKIGKKEYSKYVVVIPEIEVKKAFCLKTYLKN